MASKAEALLPRSTPCCDVFMFVATRLQPCASSTRMGVVASRASRDWLDCCARSRVHYPRPGRLEGFPYVGLYRYFLTICAIRPTIPFQNRKVVESVLEQLRHFTAREQFALLAYCFMPDHVHLLVEGLSDGSDLRRLVTRWKQVTGFSYQRLEGRPLWWSGYHDHVLRAHESIAAYVSYVLQNPVKAGLARQIGEFPFAGSDVYSEEQLREIVGSVGGEQG
jgi:putative transposase